MFDQNGLSLDQAPPISVVFSLFLMGAFFGLLSGVALLYYRSDILTLSSTGALVVTHIMTLGVMMSFMLGALFQMLPVIAGVVIESPVARSNLIKLLLAGGTTALLSGFVTHIGFLFLFAAIALGGALLYIAFAMGYRLWKITHHSPSSRGMLYTLIALGIAVILGLYMALSYAGMLDGLYFVQVRQMHYGFGTLGWIALLIASISFQTVEMFYVTPAYPKLLSGTMPPLILLLLILLTLSPAFNLSILPHLLYTLLYLLLALYGVVTLLRLSQRKRPLADATIWFWRTGMGSLVASMLILLIIEFFPSTSLTHLAILFFVAFMLSILFAMFYKIVPFLTWFHLNSQGYFTAPMMHEVIHPKTAKKHYYIHLGTLLLLGMGILVPQMMIPAALGLMLSFGWIGYQILHANRLYRDTQANGEKFDMGMMGAS